jgi:hypothetical protein
MASSWDRESRNSTWPSTSCWSNDWQADRVALIARTVVS